MCAQSHGNEMLFFSSFVWYFPQIGCATVVDMLYLSPIIHMGLECDNGPYLYQQFKLNKSRWNYIKKS